jgi:[acyl-carrier-protein] S-malonyltransferase
MTTRVAFLFPGQGSQAVGMGADICATSVAARRVFEDVDEALDFPLSTLCFQGPEDTLRKTMNAQPAIVTVSLAYLAAFQEALSPTASSWSTPLSPDFTAGHSVGEFAALVVANALDLKDTARLVRERGRLMDIEEVACPGSMMAVIGMDAEALQEICQEVSHELSAERAENNHPGQGQVTIANYNAPGQIVISGEWRALEQAAELAKARGAKKVMPLAVSGAFHSPVMYPAVDGMIQALAAAPLQNPTLPIISNITATPLTDVQELRAELAHQLATSVQWIRSVEYLRDAGVTTFIEIGPGQALAGMIKRIVKGAKIINIGNVADVEKAVGYIREMGLLSSV